MIFDDFCIQTKIISLSFVVKIVTESLLVGGVIRYSLRFFHSFLFWDNVIMRVNLIFRNPIFKKALIFLILIDLELTKLPETVQMETFISSEIILELWKGLV